MKMRQQSKWVGKLLMAATLFVATADVRAQYLGIEGLQAPGPQPARNQPNQMLWSEQRLQLEAARRQVLMISESLRKMRFNSPEVLKARADVVAAYTAFYTSRNDALVGVRDATEYYRLKTAVWKLQDELDVLHANKGFAEQSRTHQAISKKALELLSVRRRLTALEQAALDENFEVLDARDAVMSAMVEYLAVLKDAERQVQFDPVHAAARRTLKSARIALGRRSH